MERRKDLVLHIGAQVDQEVAAGYQVDARKWRITDDAVREKYAKVPDVAGDLIAAAVCVEEARAAIRGDAVQRCLWIASGAGHPECMFVDVGGKDLHAGHRREGVEVFAYEHRNAEYFLAGGAARDPNAHGVVRAALFK